MRNRPAVHINTIKLSLALHKANRRPAVASYIKGLLDEVFDAELGRVTRTGEFSTTEPPEDEKPTYISSQICVGPGTYEDGWREIVQRNPTDVRLVFDDFSATLLSVVVDNKPLCDNLGPRNIDPSVKRIINSWIKETDEELRATQSSISTPAAMEKPNKELADFIIKDSSKVLKFINDELSRYDKPQGKLVAMMIVALCDGGYFIHYSGNVKAMIDAFRRAYPKKVATNRAIEGYIQGYYKPNSNNPKRITDDELGLLKNRLK